MNPSHRSEQRQDLDPLQQASARPANAPEAAPPASFPVCAPAGPTPWRAHRAWAQRSVTRYSAALLAVLVTWIMRAALLRGMMETYPNLHAPQADVSVEMGDLLVHGNEAALTQVFSNLLGNAVKFVAPGVQPRVRVWAEAEEELEEEWAKAGPSGGSGRKVRICVEDNGIGIPQEAQGKIFGMFQRLHRAEEYPGTGIGLALVKKSLERTGGEITVESEPGKGSRFWVELPLAEMALEPH